MKNSLTTGRVNQKLRTRAAILEAAADLLRNGRTPGVDEAAGAARVSRATAYRYFPTREDLLNEMPLHTMMQVADEKVRGAIEKLTDPERRADEAERGIHDVTWDNEAAMRLLLRTSQDKWLSRRGSKDPVPIRQARRRNWFEAALDPVRTRLGKERFETLVAALCMLTGPESLVVTTDILGLDRSRARKVKSWAVRTLVREALRSVRKPVPRKTSKGK